MDAINKFPIYQPDQVLSASHLNQSLAYLEKHDRLSRRLLHGIGIVCGLEFELEEGATLRISKGVGITSQGYLIPVEEDMVLTQVRDYIPPYPPKYLPFYKTNEQPFDLWEAVPSTEAEGDNRQPLAGFNTQDKVLLLFLEAKDKDLKECVGDDCDNLGVVREFTIRPLLIKLVDLITIFNQDGNSVEDIASSVLAYNYLKEIIPPRFNVVQSKVDTVSEIHDVYESMCDELLAQLKPSLTYLQVLFAQSLGLPENMADLLTALEEKLNSAKTKDLGQQYFFDHLCDVAAAYNELADVASRWLVTCMPDEDDFPRHLVLGEFTQIKPHTPKIFRSYFKHAPTSPDTHRQKKHVQHLYKRLLLIMNNFLLQSVKEVRAMRSTYGQPLSNKAIPYYYVPEDESDQKWLLQWSFDKYLRAVWNRNAHYYNSPETQLLRDTENYNFFRIEGHLGKTYNQALSSVQKQVEDYRLPIKTIALAAGPVPFDTGLLEECNVKDLDADFDRLRESLYCQMQDMSCFFGSIPVTPRYQSIAASSETANAETHKTKSTGMEGATEFSSKTHFASVNTGGISASIDRITMVTAKATKTFRKGQFIASRCSVKPETIAANYIELMSRPDLRDKSLLDIYLPYLNLSNLSPGQRLVYLVYFFPYFVIDELEELAGIMENASLSGTNFKMLKVYGEEFMAFLKLYINEIETLERNSEVDISAFVHDIKHKLVHLVSLCKLKEFFALYKIYRQRIKSALAELEFSRFTTKHPGIDHKAGAPKGGTFIMVYHSTEQEGEEEDDLQIEERPTLSMASPDIHYATVKSANPAVRAAGMATAKESIAMDLDEANRWMTKNMYTYARSTGQQVNAGMLSQFQAFLAGLRIEERETVSLPEGTVFADFYLPYICCSSCGGIEINIREPEQTVSITIAKNRFCLGEETKEPFIVSPAGGTVSGPGVEKAEGTFVFNPAADDVSAGVHTFTYSFDGKTAQTQVAVLETPQADFEYGLDATPNGTYMSLQNKSQNAKSYSWDFGNSTTSTEEQPPVQYYPAGQETAVITLTASNGVCKDVESKTITLFSKNYTLIIGKETKSFCGLDTEHEVSIFIQGIGKETFPFDGEVKGDGVLPPSEDKPFYKFNPAKAGVGTHKLEYVVDGNVEASIEVSVIAPFDVLFEASADRSANGLTLSFSKIKPENKNDYLWYFDDENPTVNEQRTDAKAFSHFYSVREIGDRNQITVRLLVRDQPCAIDHSVTVPIPAESTGDNPIDIKFDPIIVRDAISPVTGTVSIGTTRTSTSAILTNASNPFTKGNALLTEIKTALGSAAKRKTLMSGKMNVALAKEFNEVLSGIQNSVSKNRRSMPAAKKAEAMSFYGQIAEALINVIGVLEKDLKRTETLTKTFSSAGDGFKAMKAMGMTTTVLNGIKNRLTALSSLNKPIAAGIASSINSKL